MKNKCNVLLILLAAFISAGCSTESEKEELPVIKKIPITLSCAVSAATRATDTGYDSGDKIGLYVVNYSGENPGALQQSGNTVDNMQFTYSGLWTPASAIYWGDDTTPADFYCYYPYATPSDITAHSFSVKADQSSLEAYKASEFLYGKTSKVYPTADAVNITSKHLFSCAVIKVAAGNGFTEESLTAANISVKINKCKPQASINLKDGSVVAAGETSSIIPMKEGDLQQYKALIVPQTVQADNFITVTANGREYNLKKDFTFVSGKRYLFTVVVSKTNNGVNVDIGAWEDEDIDNGGTAE